MNRRTQLSLFGGLFLALISAPWLMSRGDSPMNSSGKPPAQSQVPGFAEMTRAADLIFEGEVLAVESRTSDLLAAGQVSLPHTFVTFQVDRLFKGRIEDDRSTVTLRFLGGVDPQGRLLSLSLLPDFEVGEREVLLVKNNGEWACPLVYSAARRFRILETSLYTEDGRDVLIDDKARLSFGVRHDLAIVREARFGDQVIERVFEIENQSDVFPGTPMNIDVFRVFVSNTVKRAHTSSELSSPVVTKSLSIEDKFAIPAAQPTPPPAVENELERSRPDSEAERAERIAFERNERNPVLSR